MFAFDILCPMFSKPRTILFEIHLILTPGREDEKVFEKDPILGLIRAKSLKGILLRAQVTPLKKKRGCCKSCKGKSGKCKPVTTGTFRSFSTQREYCIKPPFT